jgi:hypothetical protein
MYGPPPDALQQLAPTGIYGAWQAWLACVVAGLLLAAWAGARRPLLATLGGVVALTTPAAAFVGRYVWGAFPTIDKAGSLLFYRDGVLGRAFEPDDPAVRLIGVHLGHLAPTALLDVFVSDVAAFNLQHLLHLVLAWWLGARLLERLCGRADVALLLAAPFAVNLHQLRDVNWYTVEKTAVFWLPLYALGLVRAEAEGGRWRWLPAAAMAGACAYNLYVAMLCAFVGAFALLLPRATVRRAVLASAVAALPFAAWQAVLMQGAGALGTPDAFRERAALDVVTLWLPKWNRLEAWRALDLPTLGLAAWGAWGAVRPAAPSGAGGAADATATGGRGLDRWLLLVGGAALTLSLGPSGNPVYGVVDAAVPGFWRMAKPETFFHVTLLATCALAARALAARAPRPAALRALAVAMAAGWVLLSRTHPAYPRFTLPVPVELSGAWQRSLPKSGTVR